MELFCAMYAPRHVIVQLVESSMTVGLAEVTENMTVFAQKCQ